MINPYIAKNHVGTPVHRYSTLVMDRHKIKP